MTKRGEYMVTTASETTSKRGGLIEMSQQQAIQIAVLGVGLGIGAWILSAIVRNVVIVPLFCGDPGTSACVNSSDVAANTASVIIVIAGLMGLVRLSVYRPLLIVLATLVSLWGIGAWTSSLSWFESLAWFVVLYALCYVAFSWLVRPQSFVQTLIAVVAAIAIIRFLPLL